MYQVKKHIGWVLLWVFLVPQFNNGLHYWVIKHDFSRDFSGKTIVAAKNLVHYCDQTLFKIPALILMVQNFEFQYFEFLYKGQFQTRIHEFAKVYFIGYYLRGPPVGLQ